MNCLVALDARAVRASVELVNRATAADLSRPTPCVGWTLRDLVSHMTAQHHGFAAAAGGDASPDRWKPRSPGPGGPAGDYRAAADTVLAAFNDDPAREFPLPEFPGSPSVPAERAIGFHFLDYVVHAWDVARTMGTEIPGLGDESLLAAALAIAQAVPVGEARTAPGAAFAPPVPAPGTEKPLNRIVALTGRDPGWTPPAPA